MPSGLKLGKIDPGDWFPASVAKAFMNVNSQRIDPGWHHPSSLAHPCDRNKQFKFIGAEEDKSSRNFLLAFTSEVGTFIHNRVQELLANHPQVLSSEESFEDRVLRVRGSSDLRVKDPDGVETILDMKTVSTIPKEPRPKDILQILWYSKAFNATRAGIIYILRNSGSMKRFTVETGNWDHVWQMSRDNAQYITEKTLRAEPVDKTVTDRKFCESRCQFLNQCDQIDAGDMSRWLPLVENTKAILFQDGFGKTDSEESQPS